MPTARPDRPGTRNRSRRESPYPDAPRQEVLYGRNAIVAALRGPRKHRRLYLANGLRPERRLDVIVTMARERGTAIESVDRERLDRISAGANHQGVALETSPYVYAEAINLREPAHGVLLAFDHLQDPQNIGSLIRTAAALGSRGILLPRNRAAGISPAVVNASAGATEFVPIAQVTNLGRELGLLAQAGWWSIGLDQGGRSQELGGASLPRPCVLVLGSEGTGLSDQIRRQCDARVAIPMVGETESLNVAAAGAIALWELVRTTPIGEEEPA